LPRRLRHPLEEERTTSGFFGSWPPNRIESRIGEHLDADSMIDQIDGVELLAFAPYFFTPAACRPVS